MSGLLLHLTVAVTAGLLSYVGMFYLRPWAERRMLDVPNSRSSHSCPTPRGGGLMIVICTLVGMWLLHVFLTPMFSVQVVYGYGAGAVLVAFVSWQDDLRSSPRLIRFLAHTAGALLFLATVGFWHQVELPLVGGTSLGWIGAPVALCWIIGLTNAYNFMDGIDGLAGGQAVVAGLGWMGLGLLCGEEMIGALGTLVAGSSLGFLFWNWSPARIFMGDVGSAFLGYTFAVLAVVAGLANARLPLAGVLVVWPFVFDTTLTLLSRLIRGQNILVAHRSHVYQRLVVTGYSHRSVTLVYVGLSLIGVLLAWAWIQDVGSDWLVIIVPSVLYFGLWRFVSRCELRTRSHE